MFKNIHQLSEVISKSAKKLVKIPFTTVLFLVEKNKILQVKRSKNGEFVIKVKPKMLGFLPFTTQMEIKVNPNDYINFEEIRIALEKFYKS